MLEVRDLDHSIAMFVLKGGLLMDDFKKLLLKIFSRDFSKILARTEKYIRLKDSLMEETIRIIPTVGNQEQNGARSPCEMVEITAIHDLH